MQRVGMEEQEIREMEEKLGKLRKEGFAEMKLGAVLVHVYLKAELSDSPIPLLPESTHSSDQLMTFPASNPDAEELSLLKKELEEENLRLQLIDRFLTEKERNLQIEHSTVQRLKSDFEQKKQENEERLKTRYWQLFEWHKQLETLLIQHVGSSLPQFPLLENRPKSTRRRELEGELDTIRTQVEALDPKKKDTAVLFQALQSAEEAYFRYLDGADPQKLTVRVEMLKNQLLSYKVQQTLLQSAQKHTSLLTSISLLSDSTSFPSVRRTALRNVLHRASTRPSSPRQPQSVWLMSEEKELISEENEIIGGNNNEEFGKCVKTVMEMQRKGEEMKDLLGAMREQIDRYKQMEEQETAARLRFKAKERRLIIQERELNSHLASLKNRELLLAQREDELRSIFSQRMTLPESEVSRLIGKSAGRVQEQIHALEVKMKELMSLHSDLNQEQTYLQELARSTDRKVSQLTQTQTLLYREREKVEALARALDRHFLRLLELSQ